MGNNQLVVQLFRNSVDEFLAKDMKGWTDACDESVVAEFPFAPPGSPSRIEGKAALYEYLRNYLTLLRQRTRVQRISKCKLYADDMLQETKTILKKFRMVFQLYNSSTFCFRDLTQLNGMICNRSRFVVMLYFN